MVFLEVEPGVIGADGDAHDGILLDFPGGIPHDGGARRAAAPHIRPEQAGPT